MPYTKNRPKRGAISLQHAQSLCAVLALVHEMLAGFPMKVLRVGFLRALYRLGRACAGVLRARLSLRLHRGGRAGRIVRRGGVESKSSSRHADEERRSANESDPHVLRLSRLWPTVHP